MAKGIKVCKICGKEYPFCKTVFKPGVFRWQDVACCEEHGSEYLARIIASRSEATDNSVSAASEVPAQATTTPLQTTAPKRSRRKKTDE